MQNKELKVLEIVGSEVISTREAAKSLIKYVTGDNRIQTFDFNAIEFASRSFVHQLISDLNELKKQGRIINLQNLSNSIQKMFDTVKKSNFKKRELISRNLSSSDCVFLSDLN